MMSASWAAPLTEQMLARNLQEKSLQITHFRHMRFYPPSNQVYEAPGLWERWFHTDTSREHERAMAFYLFNMAVLRNTYNYAAQSLSLNELGVLDAFMLCREKFNFKVASSFLREHQVQVNKWLTQFIKEHPLPGKIPTRQEYYAWARLLETIPLPHGQAAYAKPFPLDRQGPLPEKLTEQLSVFLRKAHKLAKQTVVVYDEPNVTLEDLDYKVGQRQEYRKRTYRWAAQECYYSSYLVGKLVAESFTDPHGGWSGSRIYTLTAHPKEGEFLKPSATTPFTLADGTPGLHWRYHTAVLAIVRQADRYVPVVLDHFLGGTHPMLLGRWIQRFGTDTVFTATPFLRDKTTEQVLRKPDKKTAKSVWVDGKEYLAAPVLQ